MKKRWIVLLALLVVALAVLGFIAPQIIHKQLPALRAKTLPLVSVAELQTAPEHFLHKEIEMVGTVELPVKLMNFQGFFLNDCTGKIWVSTRSGRIIPPEGDYLRVRGEVRQVATLGRIQVFILVESEGL